MTTTQTMPPAPAFSAQSGRANILNERHRIILSIIVPLYNEADNIRLFLQRAERVAVDLVSDLGGSYEIIFVNDGSDDHSVEQLLKQHERNPQIKIVNLSRNFGKENALSAGLLYSIGAAVVPMDVDLQDPPELIPALFEKWLEGYDVVYAIRGTRRSESWVKRLTSLGFYRLYNQFADTTIPNDTGDFRLMDRRVVEALKYLPERNRFMKGLFTWVGFRQIGVEFSREPRSCGESKWNYRQLWNHALDGITSSSTVPLRIWTYIGLSISFLAFSFGLFLILRTIVQGVDVPGYTSLMVTVLFFGGINLFTLGILGEYIGRIFTEVKGRPHFLVRDTYGFQSLSPIDDPWNNNGTATWPPLKKDIRNSSDSGASCPTSSRDT